MSRTQAERERVIRSKERVVAPIPAAFAEKLEAEFAEEKAGWVKWQEWEKTWNPVEVGRLLGIAKDKPVRGNIEGKVREILKERDDLRKMVKMLMRYVP